MENVNPFSNPGNINNFKVDFDNNLDTRNTDSLVNNNNNSFSTIIHKVMIWMFAILAFAIPLFFLPLTTEYYQFNKQALLITFTVIILFLWFLKMSLDQEFRLLKAKLGIILVLFLGSLIVSTFMSTDAYTSLLGNFGIYDGLINFICFILLFFILINIIQDTKEGYFILSGLFLSSIILGLIGILQSLHIYLVPIQATHIASWNTLGTPFQAAVFLIALIPLFLALGLSVFKESNYNTEKNNISYIAIVGLIVALIGTLFLLKANSTLPSGSSLSLSNSWGISLSTIKDYPFFGSGPDTFSIDYLKYRPASVISTSNWSTLYAKASNEIFQLIATTGLVGIVLLSLVFVFFLKFYLSVLKNEESMEHVGVIRASGISVIILFIGLFFTSFNITLYFTLFLLMSLFFGLYYLDTKKVFYTFSLLLHSNEEDDNKRYKEILPKIFTAITLIIAVAVFFFEGRIYLADYYFRQALSYYQKNVAGSTLTSMINAANTNPYQAVYRANLSSVEFTLANNLSAQVEKDSSLSSKYSSNITSLLQDSLSQGRNAVILSPNVAGFWQQFGDIYKNLIPGSQQQNNQSNFSPDQSALQAYSSAIALDPNNPILYQDVGEVYSADKVYNSAGTYLTTALRMKSDLTQAEYDLAQLYAKEVSAATDPTEKKTLITDAVQEFQTVLNASGISSTDKKNIQDEIKSLNSESTTTADNNSSSNNNTSTSYTVPSKSITPTPRPTVIK